MTAYFENSKTGRRYQIVAFDGKTVRLRGEHAEFVEPYDKDKFKRLGYHLVRDQ